MTQKHNVSITIAEQCDLKLLKRIQYIMRGVWVLPYSPVDRPHLQCCNHFWAQTSREKKTGEHLREQKGCHRFETMYLVKKLGMFKLENT